MTLPENPSHDGQPDSAPVVQEEPESRPGGVPLYVWVIAAVVVAIPVGVLCGEARSVSSSCPS